MLLCIPFGSIALPSTFGNLLWATEVEAISKSEVTTVRAKGTRKANLILDNGSGLTLPESDKYVDTDAICPEALITTR